jgi:DNA-binding beta-propeller fold protein YncE
MPRTSRPSPFGGMMEWLLGLALKMRCRSARNANAGEVAVALAFACAVLAQPAWSADSGQPLALERTIALAHVSGRIDHMAVDLSRHRLFVAELGNDSVDVVDLESGNLVHRFSGLKSPQGVAYVPGLDAIVVANAGNGSVHFYGGSDFATLGVLGLGDDADNTRVDPRSGHVVVGYGAGGLAVIDPATRSKLQDIKLPGHPESFQIDPRSSRAYVNVPDAGQIAVVDLAAGRQTASWTVPGLAENFPMALDGSGATIASVFRSPPRLVLLDTRTGAVTGSYSTCADADDVFFDARRQRIYVSCGGGAVDVFSHDTTGTRQITRIQTSPGARTSLFIAGLDKLYVAERAGLFADAAILVFRPAP